MAKKHDELEKAKARETAKEYFKEENVKKVKEAIVDKAKAKALEETQLTEKEIKAWEEIVATAKMPISMTDKDFVCGEGELDIRKLSKENQTQMIFRTLVLNNVYLRECMTSLIDITKFLMLIASETSGKDLTELMEKLTKMFEELPVKAKDKN